MYWFNTARDELPDTSKVLMISLQGVNHVAFFNKDRREFQIISNGVRISIKPGLNIYWTELSPFDRPKISSVLIADDDPDDQELLVTELKKFRPEVDVTTVSDGQQAMNHLLRPQTIVQLPPTDIMLLDLNMPVMDGFSVLKQMRKHKTLSQIPVYVVSTTKDIDEWDRALQLGARSFYSKGTSTKEVASMLQDIFGTL